MRTRSRRSLPPRWPRSRAMPVRHSHLKNGCSCCLHRTFVTWKFGAGPSASGRATDALEAIIRRLRASVAKPPPLRPHGRSRCWLKRLVGAYFGGNSNRPATIPGTVMSSSSSSQRKAYPLTSTWTRANCSGVAAARRRNRSAGKPIVRPSWSSTYIVRPSAHARTAAGSTASRGSSVMVLIECPSQNVMMFKN